MSTRQLAFRLASETAHVRMLAFSLFRRTLHDVPHDGACQFTAILHALNTQLHPPRAASHDALSLRHALTDFLHGRQVQSYHGPTPNVAAVLRLFQLELGPTVLRVGETFYDWSDRMRLPREWGDVATLLAAAALFRVRIHVISRASQVGEQLLFQLLFRPWRNGRLTIPSVCTCRGLCLATVNSTWPSHAWAIHDRYASMLCSTRCRAVALVVLMAPPPSTLSISGCSLPHPSTHFPRQAAPIRAPHPSTMSDMPASWDSTPLPAQSIGHFFVEVVANVNTSITCVSLPHFDPASPVKGSKAARESMIKLIAGKCDDFNPLNYRDETERDRVTPDPYFKFAPRWSTLSGGRTPYVTRKPEK